MKIAAVNISSVLLPTAWGEALRADGAKLDSPIAIFDCFAVDEGIEIVARIEEKHLPALGDLKLLVNGRPSPYTLTPIPRGGRISLPSTGDRVTLQAAGSEITLPVGRPESATFAGQNTLLTIALEPRPEVLVDWLSYHQEVHEAQAALVFIRHGPEFELMSLLEALETRTDEIKLNTLRVVDVKVPLGHPQMPAETARHLAPDAPGKAMLPDPIADPWRSPVSELAILEVARRRFLPNARAVLYCQPFDLVLRGDTNVFDAAHAVGFIKFQGNRAYPFALDNDATPKHGDHNCMSFDGKRAENIWCAAPSRMEPNNFWRQFRVSNLDGEQPETEFSYWRCMALRHPDLKVGELVPKSSLVESPELTRLMKDHFGTRPKTPPTAKLSNPKDWKNDKVLIVTTMKNEGPFILEWLAYHRSIGVTDFLVYTNDCTDGTDEMFDLLASKGLLTHAQNPYRKVDMKPQHAAYQAAEATSNAAKADWIICMDVDEYINIHIGDGTLGALFEAVPEATLISLTWRLFGNADIAAFEDKPIIEQFHKCAPALCRKPHQAWGFKTLFRNLGHYKKFGVHRPKGLKPEYLSQIRWVNGSGKEMPGKMLRTGWRSSTSTVGYDFVSLNHYALRSAESFLVKRDRGRVNHVDRDQGLAYWFRMNHNAQEERSIANKLPRFRKELAKLMADPQIARMHENCVAAHRRRIKDLMTGEEYQNLYAEITGERLRALSRLLHYFGNQVFLDGPDAVPPEFHLQHSR